MEESRLQPDNHVNLFSSSYGGQASRWTCLEGFAVAGMSSDCYYQEAYVTSHRYEEVHCQGKRGWRDW
ncbi:hypothetical protein E2C01_102180 [Portunus trituberculatus]|uniref:Uncharacterized protein n=1 Tax=Portunus trituberculatus TaxID=210409 RepID=A0A5B7K7G9_PORTR|nr:hypothetical protein [Portunus trituberculatus]